MALGADSRRAAWWFPEALFLTLLVLGTVYCYAPVRHFDFVHLDDPTYVSNNPHVRGGLSWDAARWALVTFWAGNWHPLTWLSHQADVTCFGLDSGAHHLVNLGWHVAAAVALFFALRLHTGEVWPSGIVALVFAWHPVHVESVAWISERKDVLSAFWAAISLLSYYAYNRHPRPATYWLLAGSFALALLSKSMLVTWPAVLLLLDDWPLGRLWKGGHTGPRSFAARCAEKIPLLVLSLTASVLTLVAQHRAEAIAAVQELPLADRVAHVLVSYVVYLRQSFWPTGLAVFYPYPATGYRWPTVIGAAILLAAITLLALCRRRQAPYLLVGWLWFTGMLVPVIGLVQVGSQAHADRYLYLPLVGLALAVVFGLADLLHYAEQAVPARYLRGPVGLLTAMVLLAAALGTCRQVAYWRNSDTLFRRAIAVGSDHPLVRTNLGAYALERGHAQAATEHFRRALTLDPHDVNAQVGWTLAQAALGNGSAARQAATAIADPSQLLPSAANNLAWQLATAPREADRDPAAAVRLAQSAVDRQPERPEFADTLAAALAASGAMVHAASVADAAAQRARRLGDPHLADEIAARAAAYRRAAADASR